MASGVCFVSGLVRAGMERLVARYSLVDDRPFLEPARFPWTATLEASWREMRVELEGLLARREELPNFQYLSPEAALSSDGGWKTYFFVAYGHKAAANCRRSPRTARVLEGIPGLRTAFFSVLAPHAYLPPHRGPYKGVLRCHLALIVPEPVTGCGIRVAGKTAHWHEGQCLVFDDSFEHEAWNHTDHDRAVLFLDVERPVGAPARWLNRLVLSLIGLSPPVFKWKRRYRQWERRVRLQRRAPLAESYNRSAGNAPPSCEGVDMSEPPPCPFGCQHAGPRCVVCRVLTAVPLHGRQGPSEFPTEGGLALTREQAETRGLRLAWLRAEQQAVSAEIEQLATEVRRKQPATS